MTDSDVDVPPPVMRALGLTAADVSRARASAYTDGTGAASASVTLVTLDLADGSRRLVVRKAVRPVTSGRHAAASAAPDHWAHWRRELLAHPSGLLPSGPELRSPRLLGVVPDAVYLEHVGDTVPDPLTAAAALGGWQRRATAVAETWLTSDQLAQRVAVSTLDWEAVGLDRRLADVWSSRHQHLQALEHAPRGLAHGDFGLGNLRRPTSPGGPLVAIDWATFGLAPVGADAAHLALSVLDGEVLPAYLDALGDRYPRAQVVDSHRRTLALVGASRAHWMASRGDALPAGYVDFVAGHA